MTAHKDENVQFKMEITGTFKDALSRQANEGVWISSRPAHELLNSKSEFNHPPTARIIVEKKRKRFAARVWQCSVIFSFGSYRA